MLIPDLLNARDDKGRTPIDTAREHGSQSILLALAEGENFFIARRVFLQDPSEENLIEMINLHNNMTEESKAIPNTELHNAARDGDTRSIRLLVPRGALVDRIGSQEVTPLGFAAANGHINAIDLLLNLGAQIDHSDIAGISPLHYAAGAGQVDVVLRLLDKGANIEHTTFIGETPIMTAVRYGHSNMVRNLASREANVMARDIQGWSLLHIAIDYPEVKNRADMI